MPTKTICDADLELTLDPMIPFDELIRRGRYTRVTHHIRPEHFQGTLSGQRQVRLYRPRGHASSIEMRRRMEADGFLPATIEDALALASQRADWDSPSIIVFLGTILRVDQDSKRVPVLINANDTRELSLGFFAAEWDPFHQFAAVSES